MNTPVWDDGQWQPLPKLRGEVKADVCVVGLGGSGLAAVGELLAHGKSVVGLEAITVGGGAAGRNGGFMLAGLAAFYHDAVAKHGRERTAAMYRATMAQLERMTQETPEAIRRVGSVRIAASAAELEDCQKQLSAMRADGLPVEPYAGAEGEGLFFETDGGFNPLLRCRMLARGALEGGAQLFEGSPACEVKPNEVVTPEGRVLCDAVLVAVDGRLEQLFPELSNEVRTARLQMLATAPTDEVRIPRPVYWRYGYEYWQQLPDGRIAVGGFRDHFVDDEWTENNEPSAGIQGKLEQFVREKLGVQADITHRWAASVSYSQDGLPLVRELKPGLWAFGAYSGTGNVIGALCGRGVAQRVLGEPSEWLELLLEKPRYTDGG